MSCSVIIPVYQCRDSLMDCVSSIRQAELPDYEILLIDDGSTDGSAALCDRLAAVYPEVRAFHQPHAGVSSARNRGLAAARKERILFADGDDVLDGPALREVLQAAGDLVIFGVRVEYRHRGIRYRAEDLCHPGSGALDWRQALSGLFTENLLAPVWNKVFRRSVIRESGLRFREDMQVYEDLEFVLQYLGHCAGAVNVPRAAYCYRMSDKAARRLRNLGPVSGILQPVEAALGQLGLPPKTADGLRLRLFEILAREKCGLTNAGSICRDFQNWYGKLKEKPEKPSQMVKLLLGSGMRLGVAAGLGRLRHALAAEVKTWMQIRC